MLFDLRGRGRKNTVRIIYIMLAFLMGGGLVLFGIGGGGATNGGLVDAITGSGGSTDSGEKRLTKQETAALTKIQANPKDEAAYNDLIRAQISLAATGDRYDAATDTYTA